MAITTSPASSIPPDENRLRALIANGVSEIAQELIEIHKLPYIIENGVLKDSLTGSQLYLKKFITSDIDTLKMKDDVIKLAKCPHEVLITGETGTGKELIARAMIGDREGRFQVVNCAGLPEQLIESELFGHVKGAFTGAESGSAGMMQKAVNGVFFMDEIGELPLHVQAKLLRALQDKTVRRVGGKDEEEINCKFVAATHRDIKQMVTEGKFRQDLYARISTLELHIKPLRDRECDIVPLIMSLPGGKAFLAELEKQNIAVHKMNLELNVRSIQQAVTRYSVLGRIIL